MLGILAANEPGMDMKSKSGATATGNCCEGKVVRVSGDQLTASTENGDEHCYTVAPDAKITCDGRSGDLTDLEKGSNIRLTLCEDDKDLVRAIDCGEDRERYPTR